MWLSFQRSECPSTLSPHASLMPEISNHTLNHLKIDHRKGHQISVQLLWLGPPCMVRVKLNRKYGTQLNNDEIKDAIELQGCPSGRGQHLMSAKWRPRLDGPPCTVHWQRTRTKKKDADLLTGGHWGDVKEVQGWAKEWALGCVKPAS